MSRTTRVAALTAALMTVTLAGCAQTDTGTAAPATKEAAAPLTYVIPTSWAEAATLKDAVAAFTKSSGQEVKLQAVPDEKYNEVVLSRLAGGQGMDVFAGAYNLFDVPNSLVEISGEKFESRMDAIGLDSLRWTDGKIYSFPSPTPRSTFGVFYNKLVFADAGVTVPTSLTDFATALKTFKGKGKTPLYLAGKDGWTLLQHRNSVNPIMVESDPEAPGKLSSNSIRWDSIADLNTQYAALGDWAKAGLLNKDVLTATYEKSQQALVKGEAAMIVNGSWAIGDLVKASPDAKENVGFFTFPSPSGKPVLAVSAVTGIHIAKSSKNIEGAKKFLAFLGDTAQATAYMAGAPGISNFTDVPLPADVPAAMKDIDAAITAGPTTLATDDAIRVPAPESDLIARYQELLGGRISGADFMKQQSDAFISSGKTAGLDGFK